MEQSSGELIQEIQKPLILEYVIGPINTFNTTNQVVLATWTLPKNVFRANGDYLTFDLMVICSNNISATMRLRIGSKNIVSVIIPDDNGIIPYQIKGQIWRHSKTEAKAAVEGLQFQSLTTLIPPPRSTEKRPVMVSTDGVPVTWDEDVTFTIEWESLPVSAGKYIMVEYFKAYVPLFETISGYDDG